VSNDIYIGSPANLENEANYDVIHVLLSYFIPDLMWLHKMGIFKSILGHVTLQKMQIIVFTEYL